MLGKTFRAALFATALLSFIGGAHAQLFRAYVSSGGSDANPCTLPQPCRLLPAALGAVPPGGEIWMLDSANYNVGNVVIGKDVTILAVPGAVGSVVAMGLGPAVTIAAAAKVVLRNVVVSENATNAGTYGVEIVSGNLKIENSTLSTTSTAIVVHAGGVKASGCVFRRASAGIYALAGTTVDVSDSKFYDTYYGVWLDSNVSGAVSRANLQRVTMTDTDGVGAVATAANGGTAVMVVTDSSFNGGWSGAGSSASSGSSASVSFSRNQVTGMRSDAIYQSGSGAVFESYGNNVLRGNTRNSAGTISIVGGA